MSSEGRVSFCKANFTTHGLSKHPLYSVWKDIRRRCSKESRSDYARYGGKGVTVCDRWSDFKKFYDDNISGWQPGLSIDRIDFRKGYSPENVRWATIKEQNRNKSDNRKIHYQGRTLCLIEWAEELGINYYTLKSRLFKGWDVEKAFTQPVRKG